MKITDKTLAFSRQTPLSCRQVFVGINIRNGRSVYYWLASRMILC